MKRFLKWTAIALASLIGLFLIICTLIVWILSPARLTPIVEEQASRLIDGEVHLQRVELTFWSTFPKITVDVDSLEVISHSLRSLPPEVKASLPADADSLLSLSSFHAGINVLPLLIGHISLYDVLFDGPRVNLVQATPDKANYLIFPESEEPQDTVSGPLSLPQISINRFAITDASPLRFRSIPDSLSLELALRNVSLLGDKAPVYTMQIEGNAHTPLIDDFNFSRISFGADGSITWDSERPLDIAISDFTMGLDSISVTLSADASFDGNPVLRSFSARTAPIAVQGVLTHLPEPSRSLCAPLHTSLTVKAEAELLRPWVLTDTVLPAFTASLTVPKSHIGYENWQIDNFELQASLRFDGADPSATLIDIKKIQADGEGLHLLASLSAEGDLADPLVTGHLESAVSLAEIPATLRRLIPGEVHGLIDADADIRLRPSDLTRNNFHRVYARGNMRIDRLDASLRDMGHFAMSGGEFDFGSNSRFVADGHRIDSLLTVSARVDTLAAQMSGIDVQIKQLCMGGGAMNRASTSDTTEINPFGATLAFERLKFDAPADSIRLRLRKASAHAALRRYEGNARVPRMDLALSVGGMAFGQAFNKVALRDAEVDLTVHMRPQRRRLPSGLSAERRKQITDSLAALPKVDNIEFPLDSTDRNLLRRWNFSGRIHADAGRVVTTAFPLRNRIRHVDLHFNQDSIRLSNLSYEAGQSDFLINGTISNLRRALTGRRGNNLGVHFTVSSDTINVNEIVRALFAGGAMAQQADSASVWADDDLADARLEQSADTVTASGPVLLPHNIDAQFTMCADHLLYSDLSLTDFRGDLMMYDGSLSLRDLSASTGVGSIAVNGLYSAPSADALQFGLGLKVSDFRLDGLTSLVPAIDSIMPVMKSFAGTVNADVAVSTGITPQMDIDIPSLRAVIKIEGDSLVLLDPETFRTVSKWLLFRDKKKNLIDHMAVEAVIDNSSIELYPFMFDIDRYRLGVMGHNDLAMNLNYHVSVLKSPIPFKFGINIKGTPDKLKIRLGGAKFKERMIGERRAIADNTRINIVEQMESVFRRGIARARRGAAGSAAASRPGSSGSGSAPASQIPASAKLTAPNRVARPSLMPGDDNSESLTVADSLRLIRQGFIPNPDPARFPVKSLPAPE